MPFLCKLSIVMRVIYLFLSLYISLHSDIGAHPFQTNLYLFSSIFLINNLSKILKKGLNLDRRCPFFPYCRRYNLVTWYATRREWSTSVEVSSLQNNYRKGKKSLPQISVMKYNKIWFDKPVLIFSGFEGAVSRNFTKLNSRNCIYTVHGNFR